MVTDGRELTALYFPAPLFTCYGCTPSVRKKSISWWWGGVEWGASPTPRYDYTFSKTYPFGPLVNKHCQFFDNYFVLLLSVF